MRSASLYRMSGCSLMLAGVLFAISIVLMPRGVATTIAGITARVGPAWPIPFLLTIAAAILSVAAMIGVYRHFTGSDREGWAILALSTGAFGMLAAAVNSILSGIGEPLLVRWAGATPDAVAFNAAQTVMAAATSGLFLACTTLNWLCLLPLGIAMLPDRAWPRFAVWGAIAVAIVEPIGQALLLRQTWPLALLWLIGFAYLVYLGVAVFRLGRAPVAAGVEPGVGVEA